MTPDEIKAIAVEVAKEIIEQLTRPKPKVISSKKERRNMEISALLTKKHERFLKKQLNQSK